jgi:penicillin-binding protein 1A
MCAGLPILILCMLVSGLAGALVGGYLSFSRGLPNIPDLRAYRPKTVSTFYAEDGTVIGMFYQEKRFPIPLQSVPRHVVNAFLAAEDARFFSHTGVDWIGVVRALIKNLQTGNFTQGASTITQQVTRNFLLTKEKKISRKIREAILALRLEHTLTKREILGLYLNEIYLGKGAYGIEAAARNYFGKSTQELTVGEAALLAGLVANPNRYAPHRNLKAALDRRAFVLQNMLRYGFISEKLYRQASAEVPQFREELPNVYQRAPYFTETVRQYIVQKYGEERLNNEGLQVWTTCDLDLQRQADAALREGAKAWEKRHHRPAGLVKRLNRAQSREFLASAPPKAYRVGDVVEGMVVSNDTPRAKHSRKKAKSGLQECTFALRGGTKLKLQIAAQVPFRPNDVIELMVTEADASRLRLKALRLPPVEGALVCIENRTGYVRALVGGLDFDRSRFNRAVQARRQPGSAFKPFVYGAALEWGLYGPRTIVVDEPLAVLIDPREPEWIPRNSDGSFYGAINLRQALAYSRNIAAIKLIMDVGVDATIAMARAMGIHSPLGRHLSLCLGASEVTPLELTGAYTVLPNMGVRVEPVLVKKVLDRFGNVLEDNTMEPLDVSKVVAQPAQPPLPYQPAQHSSRAPGLSGTSPPPPGREPAVEDSSLAVPERSGQSGASGATPGKPINSRPSPKRVMSPQTAYLMVSMLHDTCVFGTAAPAARLRRPDIAGKTGTTDECTDAWFVGFNPVYTTGVWMGYDTKVSLGRKEYGGVAALPVWMSFMKEALKNSAPMSYPVPKGIVFWQANAGQQSGSGGTPGEPDLAPAPELKPICPVDSGFIPASQQVDPRMGQPFPVSAQAPPGYYQRVDPQTGQPFPGEGQMSPFSEGFDDWGFSGASQPGMIRVLSPKGETLGYAYLAADRKGKTTLYPDQMIPVEGGQKPQYGWPAPSGPYAATSQQFPLETDQEPQDVEHSEEAPQEAEGWGGSLSVQVPRAWEGWLR